MCVGCIICIAGREGAGVLLLLVGYGAVACKMISLDNKGTISEALMIIILGYLLCISMGDSCGVCRGRLVGKLRSLRTECCLG